MPLLLSFRWPSTILVLHSSYTSFTELKKGSQQSSTRVWWPIRRYPVLKARYKPATTLKVEISKFLQQVRVEEQPFGRIFDMIRDIGRRCGITTDLVVDRNILNTRNRMLASLLSIRCDLAVLSDFFILRQKRQGLADQHNWIKAELHLDFSKNRQTCEDLITEATARD